MGGLIASKRFEFAASHYYRRPEWSDTQNELVFGDNARGVYGHGHNFVMYAGFSGPLDPETGMIIELSHVKRDVLAHVLPRYDHYVLNDVAAFATSLPTPENMARVLLSEIQTVFENRHYAPHHVHIIESPVSAATAYANGRVERHWQQALGHARFFDYWGSGSVNLTLSLSGIPDETTGVLVSDPEVYARLSQIADTISGLSLTGDGDLAIQSILSVVGASGLSYERAVITTPKGAFSFSAADTAVLVGVSGSYTATHRLDNPTFSLADNEACFGKCHRPHGHTFDVEISVRTDAPMSMVQKHLDRLLAEWDYQALDQHVDFVDRLCTTEHMVQVLVQKWETAGLGVLKRIRLHETPNNRFSLRL